MQESRGWHIRSARVYTPNERRGRGSRRNSQSTERERERQRRSNKISEDNKDTETDAYAGPPSLPFYNPPDKTAAAATP